MLDGVIRRNLGDVIASCDGSRVTSALLTSCEFIRLSGSTHLGATFSMVDCSGKLPDFTRVCRSSDR